MSQDMSRDHLIEKLAQFSPASNTIDRDAMLFAAGRASAAGAGKWKAAASVLACSQVVLLMFWFWPLPAPTPQPSSESPFNGRAVVIAGTDLPVRPPATDSYHQLMRQLDVDGIPPSPPVADPMPANSILSANLNSLNASFE